MFNVTTLIYLSTKYNCAEPRTASDVTSRQKLARASRVPFPKEDAREKNTEKKHGGKGLPVFIIARRMRGTSCGFLRGFLFTSDRVPFFNGAVVTGTY